MSEDRQDARRNPKLAAERVKRMLAGKVSPFWTTESGGGNRPFIKIECEDLELVHALDDFLIACVREAEL